MNRLTSVILAGLFLVGVAQLQAQFGGGGMAGSPTGPSLSGEMLKLLGEHKAFSANLEFEVREKNTGSPMTLPGRIAFADGKARFEMDLTKVKGQQIPPESIARLTQMGMDKMITISLPTEDRSLLIYPGLKSYVQMPIIDPDARKTAADFDVEITKVGEETIDGHDCIKNQVVVSDKAGKTHDATVWNATDLKDFPMKIETTEAGHSVVLVFTDVKLDRPPADQFAPPAGYTQYDNIMGMMEKIMLKRLEQGGNTAPGK